MKATYEQRSMIVLAPAALVDNASPVTTEIDTVVNGIKHNQVDVVVILGATDAPLTVLKMQESDTSGAGFTDIPGAVFGTGNAPALPGAGDDNKLFGFHIDGNGRKRFLKLVVTVADGASGGYVSSLATLSRASESPSTAEGRGFASEVFV